LFTSYLPSILDLFSSVGKIRILYSLSIGGERNITALVKETGLNHVRMTQLLRELIEHEIVLEKVFGQRIKIYGINSNSEAGKKVASFFKDWDRIANQNNPLQKELL
jgi:DNA-binding HxlR family transcriptional regulator